MAEKETSHDKLFKTVFKTFLGDLLELVRPELAAALDLTDLQYLSEDLFVDFQKRATVRPTWSPRPRPAETSRNSSSSTSRSRADSARRLTGVRSGTRCT